MIVKLAIGRGFKGLVGYQFKENRSVPGAVIGTNLGGETLEEITDEFVSVSSQRQRVAKPVVHLIVSWHPDEVISDEQMAAVGTRLLRSIDLDEMNHQHLMVRHNDTKSPHMHIVANRVGLDGDAPKWQNFPAKRVRNEATKIDIEMGFITPSKALANHPNLVDKDEGNQKTKKPRHKPTSSADWQPIPQAKQEGRTNIKTAKHQTYVAVSKALNTCDGTLEDFAVQVRKRGVDPMLSFNSKGEFNGASFTLMNGTDSDVGPDERSFTFKGSKLGPNGGLSKNRILEILEQRKAAHARGDIPDEDAGIELPGTDRPKRVLIGKPKGANLKRTARDYGSKAKPTTMRLFSLKPLGGRNSLRFFQTKGGGILNLFQTSAAPQIPGFKLPPGVHKPKR